MDRIRIAERIHRVQIRHELVHYLRSEKGYDKGLFSTNKWVRLGTLLREEFFAYLHCGIPGERLHPVKTPMDIIGYLAGFYNSIKVGMKIKPEG